MSWLQLANKTAIVTGAGSGIGAAVVKSLLSAKCRVVMADQNMEGIQQVAKKAPLIGNDQILLTQCDVTNSEEVSNLIRQADDFASTPFSDELVEDSSAAKNTSTLLVNCAGITRDNWISKMSIDEWTNVMDVNLTGTFLTCQAFCNPERLNDPILNATNTCHSIVNIGSVVSEFGNLGQVNYAASKGGVLGLTRSLAKESAKFGVRVNAVVPGFIDTPMAQAVPKHVKEQIIPKIALKRFGSPEEIADLVSFLLSRRSGYITGEAITASGMISL